MGEIVYIKDIPVTLEWRKVKNMNLYVKYPDGKVLVTAPIGTDQMQILAFLHQKENWIVKHHEEIVRQNMKENSLHITEVQMQEFQKKLEKYIAKWEPIMGVHASHWTMRTMKTRWGSCTVTTGRIRINTRLILYPEECLEYVVIHELCHLIEPSHNQRFKNYMTKFLPDWKQREKLLRD